jgi:cellulose synthase/poly-beta-1,6-N-acetylglucosamine synthase-like glycosyltransferase
MELLKTVLLEAMFITYVITGIGLVVYGFTCYYSVFLFLKNSRRVRLADKNKLRVFRRKLAKGELSLPMVTTQLPVFNEANCVERLIDAVCAIDYPRHLHEIQVLDDSTDDCVEISRRKVAEMQGKGYDIHLVTRTDRKEYKAGALKAGMKVAKGEFIAIFDADFVPQKDFLMRTVPYMVSDASIGLVQGRWGHLNRNESGLTVAQSIGIDGHFVIEQSARSWGNLFMNFNGTAGVWRRQAIDDAGGWEGDTLTEDMDLSYRSQLAGWKMKYVFDVIVPAELPSDINAFKSQQYRWAKGSIQTAMKIMPRVIKADVSFHIKLHSFLHMTHYMIHPLMLTMALLAFPLLAWYKLNIQGWPLLVAGLAILFAAVAPSTLYFVAQKASGYLGWKRRILAFPILMSIGVGIAVNNTRAVFSALTGKQSAFVRTPKKGDKVVSVYKSVRNFPGVAFLELLVGAYCAFGLLQYLDARKYLVGPFLALYAIGFLAVGTLSMMHFIENWKNSLAATKICEAGEDLPIQSKAA